MEIKALWVLSAQLFNSENQGIYAKSIDNNQKIKYWASNNTSLESINSINQAINYTNSSNNYQSYILNEKNQNINPIYQSELETSNHKHRHEKSRNRFKRQNNNLVKKWKKAHINALTDIYRYNVGLTSSGNWGGIFTPEFWE